MRRLLVLRLLAVPAMMLTAVPAMAQPEAGFTGEARTGADTRPARFVFTCSANGRNTTGVLGVSMALPRHDTLRPLFAFDRFEGPDATAGRLTRLQSSVGGASLSNRFVVSGSIGVEADEPFIFGLYAARRGDQARLNDLGRIMRPLTQGSGKLVWEQLNVLRGGLPIIATLELGPIETERLRSLLGPCLTP
jgi:hypothetical protein